MLLVFTSIASLFVDAGFGVALIQRPSLTENDETTVFLFSAAAGLVLTLLLLACSPGIARFYEVPKLAAMLPVLSLVLPFNALATVPDALLTRRLDFRARTASEAIGSLTSGTLAIMLAFHGFGAWSLVFQAVAGSALRTAMLWVFSNWRPRGRFSIESFRNLLGFGGYMLLTNMLDTITIRIQSILIGKLFDSTALGYYTVAQNTQQAPASFFGSILNRVGLPVFSSVSHQPTVLRDALRISLRTSMYAFVPCMLGIAVLAKPLIPILYGDRWTPAAPILSILALASMFWPLHVLNLAAISAQGRSDLFLKLAVAKKVVAISLIIAASPYGPVAIAWATLAASLVAIVINTHYTAKLLHYGIIEQVQDMANTMVCAFAAAISGYCVLHFTSPSWVSTTVSILLSATVYVGCSIATHSLALREVLDMVRRIRAGARSAPAQTAETP